MDDGFDRKEVQSDLGQNKGGDGGRERGGGPGASDMGAGGGSSGSGGYGNDQNAQNQQGEGQSERTAAPDRRQSRGERFDEMAGGGRGADSVSFDRERDGGGGTADEFEADQRAHQDRGQTEAEDEV